MSRETSRRVPVSRETIRQSVHHLTNFLSFLVPMSQNAERQAKTPEEAQAAKAGFFQLFVELQGTIGALNEAAGEQNVALARQLDELAAMPEYQAALAAARAQKRQNEIQELFTFPDALEAESKLADEWDGKATAFDVTVPQHCRDFGWLINHFVIVNGKEWLCVGVDYAGNKPPFRRGERVRLVVVEPPPQGEEQDDAAGPDEALPGSPAERGAAVAPDAGGPAVHH